jgi:hypothetical protein
MMRVICTWWKTIEKGYSFKANILYEILLKMKGNIRSYIAIAFEAIVAILEPGHFEVSSAYPANVIINE